MTPSLQESYATIPLTQGQVAIVDVADYEWLNQWKWQAQWDSHVKSYYALRAEYLGGGRANCKLRYFRMHRQILGLESGDLRKGDHQNGDTLDNRRANLRIATTQENARNRKRRSTGVSGFKGVSWYARDRKWRASICVGGRYISLGLYTTPELAHEAYCKAAKMHFGEFFRAG
jgi:hypothetical protein